MAPAAFSEKSPSRISDIEKNKRMSLRNAGNQIKMMALINRKRKKPVVEEVKDEETKIAEKAAAPSSKLRKLLGSKLGTLKYLEKAEEQKKATEQSHLKELHDMEALLDSKTKKMEEERLKLQEQVEKLEQIPKHMREDHEKQVKGLQEALEHRIKDVEQQRDKVAISLKQESEAQLAHQREELAQKYLKELHDKEEKMAVREAVVEKEKQQLEDQIATADHAHKDELLRLQDKLLKREAQLAKRRDQLSQDIEKQSNIAKSAKAFRRRSVGAIGKFIRMQTKSKTWHTLQEEAERKRLKKDAERKVKEELEDHHKEYMNSFGEDEDEEDMSPFPGMDMMADEGMFPGEDDNQGTGPSITKKQIADLEKHREETKKEQDENVFKRKKIGGKMARVRAKLRLTLKAHRNVEEQLLAVEQKMDAPTSEKEARDLAELHETLLSEHDRHEEAINEHEKVAKTLNEEHQVLADHHAKTFLRPIEVLRSAVRGKVSSLSRMALFRRKAERQRELEKVSKIRDYEQQLAKSNSTLQTIEEQVAQVESQKQEEGIDGDTLQTLEGEHEKLAARKLEEEENRRKAEEEKLVEEYELEALEKERTEKEIFPMKRLRQLVVKNQTAVKLMSDMSKERDSNQKALQNMKETLEAHEATLEAERESLKTRYDEAIRNRDMATQSKLAAMQHGIDEKEKALDQKQEALENEIRIDHEERAAIVKDRAAQNAIDALEAALEEQMLADQMLEEERVQLRNKAIRIARISIPELREKKQVTIAKQQRELSRKKKKALDAKLGIEKKLEREIKDLKQRRERESKHLKSEIEDIEGRLNSEKAEAERIESEYNDADDLDREDLEISLSASHNEIRVHEMRLVSLRNRLINIQHVSRVHYTMLGSSQSSRETLRKLEKMQNVIDDGEIEIERKATAIDKEKYDMKSLTDDAKISAESHMKHLQDELDKFQEEVESKKYELEQLLLKQLHDTEEALQTVSEDANDLKFNKRKEDLMSLLHHVHERDDMLNEELEIIRCDKLEDISRNMPVDKYEAKTRSVKARQDQLNIEKIALEHEMEDLVNTHEKARKAKLERLQAKSELEAAESLTGKMENNNMENVRKLEIRHLELSKRNKQLDADEQKLVEAAKRVMSLPPAERAIEEQIIATAKLNMQLKKEEIQLETDEIDASATKIMKIIEGTSMAVITRQKEGLLAMFLRSLDHENFQLNERSAILNHELREIQHRLKQDVVPEQAVLVDREEQLKSQLEEIKNEKERIDEQTVKIAEIASREKEIALEARKAIVDHAERQKLENLYNEIDTRMERFKEEFNTAAAHEFTRREMKISESAQSLIDSVGGATGGLEAVNEVSQEIYAIMSEADEEKRMRRQTHSEQMLELHSAAEAAKENLYSKLAKMKSHRRALLGELNKLTDKQSPEGRQLLENFNSEAKALGASMKNLNVDVHRIDLEMRESERDARKRLRDEEGRVNQRVLEGLSNVEATVHSATENLQQKRKKLRKTREEMEENIKTELAEAVEALQKNYAKKLTEEGQKLQDDERQIKSEIVHNQDLMASASDEDTVDLQKKIVLLNDKLSVLSSAQVNLSELRRKSDQSINDQAARHEKGIRAKYEKEVKGLEEGVKRAVKMLEFENKKIETGKNRTHDMEETLLKHTQLDVDEAERDKKGLEVAKELEQIDPDDPKLKQLHAEMNKVHQSTDDLQRDREELNSKQHHDESAEVESVADSDLDQAIQFDTSPDQAPRPDDDSSQQARSGSAALAAVGQLDLQALSPMPSEEQIKALDDVRKEIAKIERQKTVNEEQISKMKEEMKRLEAELEENGTANAKGKSKDLEGKSGDESEDFEDKEDELGGEEAPEESPETKSKLERVDTLKLKIQGAVIAQAKLNKQGAEFSKMKDELDSNKRFIDKLKVSRAAEGFAPAAGQPASKDSTNEDPKLKAAKKVEVEFSVKLEVEKKKRAAMEEEDVQIAKEQRDKEIDRLEGERAALEKQREEAVQSVQQIAAEKEEQQKLVDEKKIPKASLKQLLLKHMNHLKAVEKFNLKLKTLQAKEEKIHADHSAAVAKAKIEKQKHIGKLLRKHKKALDRIALIEAERRRINQLEKKIRDDKSAADKKSALLKKNRFSNLMKKHKQEFKLKGQSTKQSMQMDALREGMRTARERIAKDRANAEQLRAELEKEKERYRKRSWIRLPQKSEIQSATRIQSWHRGNKSRALMPMHRIEKAKADARRGAAATRIQSLFRGYVGREKAKFRQKLADMGMVYQWKRGPVEEDDKIKSVGINTELGIVSNEEPEGGRKLLLHSGSGSLSAHPSQSHALVAPDSLMSTARSDILSDWSVDSMESISMKPRSGSRSGDLYRHTEGDKAVEVRSGAALKNFPSVPAVDPYSNMFPANRADLINQAIGVLVGNEQKGISKGRKHRRR